SVVCFFFSSRRRHTRWPRDWSSDVCSSDLGLFALPAALLAKDSTRNAPQFYPPAFAKFAHPMAWHSLVRDSESSAVAMQPAEGRSEERRVGKECRAGWRRQT